MIYKKNIYVALLACGFFATTVYGEEDLTPKDGWSGQSEFGYVNVQGNTETTTIKARLEAEANFNLWTNKVLFEALNASDDNAEEDKRSAEKYFLSDELDRELSEKDYLFGYLSYEDDRFSGYAFQATSAIGYGRKLIERDDMTWDISAGPGYRYSKLETADPSGDDTEGEVIIRMNTEYSWKFSDTAQFDQTLSVEAGSDNTITRSSTSLKTTLVGDFYLKLAYNVKYQETVPQENKHADTETVVTLAFDF